MPPTKLQVKRRLPPKHQKEHNVKTEIKEDVAEAPKQETASGLSQDDENQFILELCWCIQELQAGLASGKIQGKQALDINKSLNTLKSNTAPLVKKRQIMRNTLGNYREKMNQDEKKFGKTVSSVRFTDTRSINKKFVFLKKANKNETSARFESDQALQIENFLDNNDRFATEVKSKNEFKFNFQCVTENQISTSKK